MKQGLSTKQQFCEVLRPNFLSLKLFGESWFGECTSLLLIIMLNFNFSERKTCSTIKKSQNVMNTIAVFRHNLFFWKRMNDMIHCFQNQKLPLGGILQNSWFTFQFERYNKTLKLPKFHQYQWLTKVSSFDFMFSNMARVDAKWTIKHATGGWGQWKKRKF